MARALEPVAQLEDNVLREIGVLRGKRDVPERTDRPGARRVEGVAATSGLGPLRPALIRSELFHRRTRGSGLSPKLAPALSVGCRPRLARHGSAAQAFSCFGSCVLPLYLPHPPRRLPIYRLYGLWSVLPAHSVAKGHVSTSLGVPTHYLEYELPRTTRLALLTLEPPPRRSTWRSEFRGHTPSTMLFA
jgi:hypothetical protein